MQWLEEQSKRCFYICPESWVITLCARQDRAASRMLSSISMLLGWRDVLPQGNLILSCPPSLLSLPTQPHSFTCVWGWTLHGININSPDSKENLNFSLSPKLVCCLLGPFFSLFSLVLLLFGLLLLHLEISLTPRKFFQPLSVSKQQLKILVFSSPGHSSVSSGICV